MTSLGMKWRPFSAFPVVISSRPTHVYSVATALLAGLQSRVLREFALWLDMYKVREFFNGLVRC